MILTKPLTDLTDRADELAAHSLHGSKDALDAGSERRWKFTGICLALANTHSFVLDDMTILPGISALDR